MSPDLLALFDPSPNALIDLLRERIDDSMLVEIASADVPFQVDANLRALIPIRQTGKIHAPLEWEPKEVLELTRWDEPDDTRIHPQDSGYDRLRGHTNRAFACAILLRAGGDPQTCDYLCGENDTLAQLLMSVVRLMDRELQWATAQLVAWRMGSDSTDRIDPEMPAFFELALLWLGFFRADCPFGEPMLVRLADSVITAENDVREKLCYQVPDGEQWLLGLTFYDQKDDVWQALARQVANEASRLTSDVARAKVLDISSRLLGRHT